MRRTDIRLTVPVKAGAAEIYKALSSARELCRWWLDGAETEAKSMGRFRMVWPRLSPAALRASGAGAPRVPFPPQAARGEAEGVFMDLEPGRKLSWFWKLGPYKRRRLPALASFFILEKKKRLCELTLVHAGFRRDASSAKAHRLALLWWEDCLAKLRLYLEKGQGRKNEFIARA